MAFAIILAAVIYILWRMNFLSKKLEILVPPGSKTGRSEMRSIAVSHEGTGLNEVEEYAIPGGRLEYPNENIEDGGRIQS